MSTLGNVTAAIEEDAPLPQAFPEDESTFYRRYAWCLDVFPAVRDVRLHLLRELSTLDEPQDDWRRQEMAINVFLLSCAIADAADDFLAGPGYDFSRAVAVLPILRPVTSLVERVLDARRSLRTRWLGPVRAWRAAWGSALDDFLQRWLAGEGGAGMPRAADGARLARLLERELPAGLGARRTKVPAAFRTQDFTHHDVVRMADDFAAARPDRERALLVVGLRTAGSYFAPVIRAILAQRGYRDVEAVTLRPKKGIAPWEQAALARCAARRGLALLVDEPAYTGTTLAQAVGLLSGAGVPPRDVVVLLPVHPTHRNWNGSYESLPLTRTTILPLDPEAWRKQSLLDRAAVNRRLEDYFRGRGYSAVAVVDSRAAERFNQQLQQMSDEKFHTRLKRVYEVRLRADDGRAETRYVLAKSVGWGWLGYQAFLVGEALAEFVPPVLGLRDGILYTEWLPQPSIISLGTDRAAFVRGAASYVAARVKALSLAADPGPELDSRHQKGLDLLATALSGAYGSKPASMLKSAGLRHALARRPCPLPTLIDGKMRQQEWVRGGGSFLKTDFEQHGLGKTELNVTDPAYDLAEIILNFGLSPAEEGKLLQRYRELSGDERVADRLFLNKLLAGSAAVSAALDSLRDPRLGHRHQEFNRIYIEARDFLTRHSARWCGERCRIAAPRWCSPLVVMDIDGVLDKQIFGFPTTTAAGMQAISLLHAHGAAVALNTARTLDEVREYARCYGCVGGVAEYGSVVWDAVTDRTRPLVAPESREEVRRAAEALRPMPGVFLDDRYEHSLRAYAYEGGRTVPLPRALAEGTLAELGLERLVVHQTHLDTTILAREVDKGRGLRALLELAGHEDVDTIAIGDSEPDLAMFRVARRSFAPSHISGRAVARLLGCRITARSYQPGLLSAVRSIVHADGGRCAKCESCPQPADDGLWWELMKTADRKPFESLLRALADPATLQTFVR